MLQVCNSVCSGNRPHLPNTLSKPLSELIQKCWHQSPNERPTCADILQTLGKLSFPDNWKALLGTCNTTVTPELCNGKPMGNDAKLNVIVEDIDIRCGGLTHHGAFKARKEEDNLNLDESEEKPRAPIFSRSLSAPIPTPPPPPPMPKPHSMFIAPNIITPDPGKRCGLIESSNGYGFGITTEEIQRQKQRLKSRVRCPNTIYY